MIVCFAATEVCCRWHDSVNVGASGFDFAVAEGVFIEPAGLRFFQIFRSG